MTNIPKKLKRKMDALAAMADSADYNESEAAIATKQLHALLAKHNISDIVLNDDDDIDKDNFDYSKLPWVITVTDAIAKLYFCHTSYNDYWAAKRSHTRFYITGSALNREYTIKMAQIVLKTIAREARAKCRDVYGSIESSYITSFRNSAAERIYWRCMDLKAAGCDGTLKAEDGDMLPSLLSAYEREDIRRNEYFKRKGESFNSRTPRLYTTDGQGRDDGRTAGDSISLDGRGGGVLNAAPKQITAQ